MKVAMKPFEQLENCQGMPIRSAKPQAVACGFAERKLLGYASLPRQTTLNARFNLTCRTVLIPLLLSSLTLFPTGCGDGEAKADAKGQQHQEAVPVTLGKSELRPVVRTVDITGTLWGDQDVTLGAKVPGRISDIFADVGDRVTAGEAPAQIDKTDYELEYLSKESAVTELLAKLGLTELPKGEFDATNVPTVRRAKLQADNAEAKFNRGKRLHDQPQPLISDQDFADPQDRLGRRQERL